MCAPHTVPMKETVCIFLIVLEGMSPGHALPLTSTYEAIL
jgi:hypothetical protein